MPGTSPFRIERTAAEAATLTAIARRYWSPYRDVIRAKIVLYAARGLSHEEIAHRLDPPRPVVSTWRHRFFLDRLAGLEERPRLGRPSRVPPQRRRRDQGPGL